MTTWPRTTAGSNTADLSIGNGRRLAAVLGMMEFTSMLFMQADFFRPPRKLTVAEVEPFPKRNGCKPSLVARGGADRPRWSSRHVQLDGELNKR